MFFKLIDEKGHAALQEAHQQLMNIATVCHKAINGPEPVADDLYVVCAEVATKVHNFNELFLQNIVLPKWCINYSQIVYCTC